MKVRRPKSEGRKKAEIRSPKSECLAACEAGLSPLATAVAIRPGMASLLGFQVSALFRFSGFGLRMLPLAFWLLAPALLAATNSSSPSPIPPLRPARGELPPAFWDQYGVWVVLAGLLVLAALGTSVWLLIRRRPPVVVAPEVIARLALEPLSRQPEDGMLLSRASQIVRHYVAAAFKLPPGELTTAEFCRAIACDDQISPELADALSDFLHQCDQRKFSPPAPGPPLSAVAQAYALIEQSQARLAALAQAASPATPGSAASQPREALEQ
jgi:hypothetical protein